MNWDITDAYYDPHGNFVVKTQDILDAEGNPAGHTIQLPPEAIGSRMALYGLDTPEEAVDAILREHGCRLDPDIKEPYGLTKKEAPGGLHSEVTIVYGKDVKTKIDKHLTDHSDKITEAKEHRWDRYKNIREGIDE